MAPIPVVISNQPHMEVKDWLTRLELIDYEDHFKKFVGVEELISFNESDIKQLGVKNSAHRARMVSSLIALKESFAIKTRNGSIRRSNKRFSLAITNTFSKSKPIEENGSTYELLTVNTKQSKSLGDLLEMESPTPDTATSTTQAQDAIALKKALEWELSLDSRDLRSHAWYHGPIPRVRAEEIVQTEGDFLIRDCVSQPGNYVLTCRTKTQVLHFVLNKLLIQPETVYERVQYQFEDEPFDTVPDLITFYVGSGKPISAASGARIQHPCNRLYPLSFYANKYGIPYSNSSGGINSPSPVPGQGGIRFNPYTQQNTNTYRSPMSSPPRVKRETPPRLPSKKQRSQSLTPIQPGQAQKTNPEKYCSADGVIRGNCTEVASQAHLRRILKNEKCNSADGVIHKGQSQQQTLNSGGSNNSMSRSIDEKSTSADGVIHHNGGSQTMSRSTGDIMKGLRFSTQSLPRTQETTRRGSGVSSRTSSLNRDVSDNSLSPCLEQKNLNENDENKAPSPPPKPNRSGKDADQQGPVQRVASYHASGSDSGNGSGDSAQSSATGEDLVQHRGGVIIKNPRFIPTSLSSVTLKSFVDIDPVAAEEALMAMDIPPYEQNTKFDLENFHTLLLPFIDYKPLDSGTLNTFKMMISETSPRVIANHMTRVDIRLILGDIENPKKENPLESNGIELITLEHGKQFRKDLIERTQCLKLLVAVTIITCTNDAERAEMLHKWITIAVDTKTALGNLFGFASIMLGLCMPQIQKLESTWHILRQKYTDSAFNFEAKLRPTLKNMNDCSNPQAPNTTVPHLLPYVLLKDRTIHDLLDPNAQAQQTSLVKSCIIPFETNTSDFGFSILFAHLDSVRNFINNMTVYNRNSRIVMNDNSRLDPLLEDAFRTEFHIKFLWGSKGAFVSAEDRHSKFEQVLGVMADQLANQKEVLTTVNT